MVLFGKTNGQTASEKPVKEHGSLRRISSLIFNEDKRPPTASSHYEEGRVGRPISINPTPPLCSPKDSGFSSWQTTRASSIDSRASSRAASVFSIDTPHGLAQTLLRQGRKLKRHASKLSLSSLNGDNRDSASVRDTASPACSVRSSMDLGRESPVISAPCNFQHITHAKAQQFTDIHSARDDDLILEFSVLRASQVSRTDLRDIRADDIQSRRSSVDFSVVPSLGSMSSRDSLVSSGLSTPGSRLSIRSTRSKDSFSQPYHKLRRNRLGPPPVAPPRISSKWAFTRGHRRNQSSESSLGEGRTSEDSYTTYGSDQDAQRSPSLTSSGEEGFDHGRSFHAVSTEGDYAYEHEMWYYGNYDNVLPCVQEEETLAEPDENSSGRYNGNYHAQSLEQSDSAYGRRDVILRPSEAAQRDSGVEVSPNATPKSNTKAKVTKAPKPANARSEGGLFSAWRDNDDDSDSDVDPFIKTYSTPPRKPSTPSKAAGSTPNAQRKPWRSPGSSSEPTGKGYTPKLNKQLPKISLGKSPKSPADKTPPSSRPETPKSRPQTPKAADAPKACPPPLVEAPKVPEGAKIQEAAKLPEAPSTPEAPKQVNGVSATVEGTKIKLTPGFFSKGANSAAHHMVQVNLKQLHDTLAQLESQFTLTAEPGDSPPRPSRIPVSSALKTALKRPKTPSRRKNVAFASDTVSPQGKLTKPVIATTPEPVC